MPRSRLMGVTAILATGGVAAAFLMGSDEGASVVAGAGPDGSVQGEVADALRIACRTTGIEVLTSRVATQPDGVHVEIVELDDDGTSVELASGEKSVDEDVGGLGSAYHQGETVLNQIGPGPAFVRCYPDEGPRHFMSTSEDPRSVAVEIVDPGGHWRAPGQLECESNLRQETILDYAADVHDAAEETSDEVEEPLEEVAMGDLPHRRGDLLEPVGYPEANSRWVRVVRDGRVVALASYAKHGGGWLLGSISSCDES